jgi:hypothetical protein
MDGGRDRSPQLSEDRRMILWAVVVVVILGLGG